MPKKKKQKNHFIKDIPSLRKPLESMENFSDFKLFLPFFEMAGVNSTEINVQLEKIGELKKEFETLSSIPDKFNDIFSSKGWIIYDQMNIEIAKEAGLSVAFNANSQELKKISDIVIEKKDLREILQFIYV